MTGAIDAHVHRTAHWPTGARARYRAGLVPSLPALLEEMDAGGVEAAVSLPYPKAPTVDDTLREGSSQLVESHGRLWPTSTVDPTRGVSEVTDAIQRWENARELVAIKLFPGYQAFYPHDLRLAPVYEFAHRRDLPVLIHQGDTLETGGLIKYARPVEVDEVAVRYRDVRFVLCHLGNPWIGETAEVMYKNENVFTDTSGLLGDPSGRYYPELHAEASRELHHLILSVGNVDRILYGSDWPLASIAESMAIVEHLPIDPSERAKILGQNARALFRTPASGTSAAFVSRAESQLREPQPDGPRET